MTTPAYDELVELVRRDGTALVEAVRGDLDAPVRTCGDWDARRLLAHVGRVYRMVATLLMTRAQVAPRDKPPSAGADVVEYCAEGLAMVADAFAATPPDADVWNWVADRPAAAVWWARRTAYETVVHRADAELAVGRSPSPVEPALAADAIDEFLEVMLPRQQSRAAADGLVGTVHLHATDLDEPPGAGEWLLTLTPTTCEIRRGHAKGDVAVRGTAGDLLLVVYNRLPPESVEVHGDARLLDVWRTKVRV